MTRRAHALVAAIVFLTVVGCAGDDGETSATTASTATPSTVVVSTVVPRTDDAADLTARFPPIDGYTYVAAGDAEIVGLFGDAVTVPNAPDVFEAFAARRVEDADGTAVAAVLAARFSERYRDDDGESLARSFSSRQMAGERVYLAQIAGADGSRLYRYMWFSDGVAFMVHGTDQALVEQIVTAAIDAA
ncbi:MAG TPA: hypothetical protein VFZ83_08125 [Acidimicrobiia bacterium]|nr:hypothetical protein [Acidimicrobiia bacterium]